MTRIWIPYAINTIDGSSCDAYFVQWNFIRLLESIYLHSTLFLREFGIKSRCIIASQRLNSSLSGCYVDIPRDLKYLLP